MSHNNAEDIKNFENPKGYWEHEGPYSIELTPEADKAIVPASAEIKGDTVIVSKGTIKQTVGGIQFESAGKEFFWGYSRIKAIRNGNGSLVWVNNNHR